MLLMYTSLSQWQLYIESSVCASIVIYSGQKLGWKDGQFLFSSCGDKTISHRDFRLNLVRNLLAHSGQERNVQCPIGRPPATATQVVRLEDRGRKHWSVPSATRRRCRVCSASGVNKIVSVKCQRCDVALCVDRKCSVDCHTETNPWNSSGCSTVLL